MAKPLAGFVEGAEQLHRPLALGHFGKGLGESDPFRVDDESQRATLRQTRPSAHQRREPLHLLPRKVRRRLRNVDDLGIVEDVSRYSTGVFSTSLMTSPTVPGSRFGRPFGLADMPFLNCVAFGGFP